MVTLPFDKALRVLADTIKTVWPETRIIRLSWEPSWTPFDADKLPAAFIAAAPIEPEDTTPHKYSCRLDLEIVYADALPSVSEALSFEPAYAKCVELQNALQQNLRLVDGTGQATCSGVFFKGIRPATHCALSEWAERVRAYLGMCGLGLEIWIEEIRG